MNLHRLHRLSENDERERIAAAGGKVLKNRWDTLVVYLELTHCQG